MGAPVGAVAGLHARQQVGDDRREVADQADVDLDVLVDLGAVDLDVDLLGVERVGLDVAGHPVVEAHAERDQQVGFLDGGVHPGLAVHAHHAEVERMRGRDAADAEQRHRDRDVGVLGEPAHHVGGAGVDDAVAGEDQRPLGGVNHLDGAIEVGLAGTQVGPVAERRVRFRPLELARALLAVLGEVDEHRAGPAGAGDVERLAHGGGDVLGVRHQVVVLGDRQGDAGDVGFLEGVRADQLAAHLAGDADDRGAVHHRRGDAGHQVGGAGARGRDRHADLAGGAGVAVGHVGGALLVPDQDVTDGVVEHRVVGGEDRPARIPEHARHAFADERFPEDLCAGAFLTCHRLQRLAGPRTVSQSY